MDGEEKIDREEERDGWRRKKLMEKRKEMDEEEMEVGRVSCSVCLNKECVRRKKM